MQKRNRPVIVPNIFLSVMALFLAILACSGIEDPRVITAEDVSDKDLSKGNWFFASFCDLNLSAKDFSEAELSESIFQKVNLEGAILRGADLSYASLQFANLRGADLTGATLDNASFTSADLTGAILDEKWARIMPLLVSGEGEAAELQGFDLRNVNFHGYMPPHQFCDRDLYEWDQTFVFNLSDANLENAVLDEANLYRVNLENANLRFATLKNTNLRDANLDGANLQFAVLTNALVDQFQLQSAILGCTVLPDGTIHTPESCDGQTPGSNNEVE